MSVNDGFNFWAGKALWEWTVFIGCIVGVAVIVAIIFLVVAIRDSFKAWRKRRAPSGGSQ